MPWRRPRQRPQRVQGPTRTEEETLELASASEEEVDAVELARADGATIAEAAGGELDSPGAASDLATQLSRVLGPAEPSREGRARAKASRRHADAPSPGGGDDGAPHPEDGVDLEVEAARGLRLRNPVVTASGTFGQGVEYADLIDVARLGALVNKGTTVEPRPGNPQYRIAETPSGILNSIGLENPGAAAVARTYARRWPALGCPIVVNVAGHSVDDYVAVVREMAGLGAVAAFELNVSCPNVEGGTLFGCDPSLAAEVVRAVKAETDLPVIVKLTPNAPDVVGVARAVEDAGADGLTAINTILGMRIDVARRRPVLGTGSGGLSGPAIRPIAVHLTYQVAQAVSIPIMGAGGVTSAEDALEFLMAGASAVQVGTATFADPLAPLRVIEGLAAHVRANGLSSIREVIGAALPRPAGPEEDAGTDGAA